MADISKITALNGTTYDLKDSTARESLVPSGGSDGQVLTRVGSSGAYAWQDPSGGGGNVNTVNNISPDVNKNVQTQVALTQAQYDALATVDPNVMYLITDANDYNAEKSNITLYASNWSSGIYTVTDARIDASTLQVVIPTEGITDVQLEALQSANIQASGQDTGHVYLKAYGDVPSIDVPVTIIYQTGVQIKEVEAGGVKPGAIATVESNPATASHAVGDYILYQELLYKVTAAISAGETLVVGTNIESTKVGDELSSLNSNIEVYKTNVYSGTTASAGAVLGTVTLPKGKYIVTTNGYSSLYSGILTGVGYLSDLTVLDVPIETQYTVTSPSSSSITWTLYQGVFIKIG